MSNSVQYIEHARKCNTISPHRIFRTVGMRIFKPLYNLISCFRFCTFTKCFSVIFKNIRPFLNFFFRRIFCFQTVTPPYREPLQQRTFLRCQTSYYIFRTVCIIYKRRVFVIACNKCICTFFFGTCNSFIAISCLSSFCSRVETRTYA